MSGNHIKNNSHMRILEVREPGFELASRVYPSERVTTGLLLPYLIYFMDIYKLLSIPNTFNILNHLECSLVTSVSNPNQMLSSYGEQASNLHTRPLYTAAIVA